VSYRIAGDFTRAGKQAEAPLVPVRFERPLAIMKHQVGAAAPAPAKRTWPSLPA
jgi:hypothetical protein